MIPYDYGDEPREVILRRIKWLMSLRLVLATFSLGTAVFIQLTEGKPFLDPYLISLYCHYWNHLCLKSSLCHHS